MSQLPNNYNLEERTAKFGETVIVFCKNLAQDTINKPIINTKINPIYIRIAQKKELSYGQVKVATVGAVD